jgi:colicin import membrane protein
MTFLDPIGNRSLDSPWIKMILISLGLHTLVFAFFLNVFPKTGISRRLEPAYIVNLVSAPGGGPAADQAPPVRKEPAPTPKTEPRPNPKSEPAAQKPTPPKIPAFKAEESKSLDQALEKLKKKVDQEKSLEKSFDRLERKVKSEEALDQALTKLEKKRQTGPAAGSGTMEPAGSGSGSISSATTGGTDGLGVQFQIYHASLRSRIKKNWVLPENLLKRTDLSAEILVRIGRSGRLEDFRFEKKSGSEGFDQEVIRTLKKSDPLPPLPDSYPKGSYEIILTFYAKDLSN